MSIPIMFLTMMLILTAGYAKRETEREETVDHIVSACATIVNTEYLKKHDGVANFIHWILCKNFNLATQKNSMNKHCNQ